MIVYKQRLITTINHICLTTSTTLQDLRVHLHLVITRRFHAYLQRHFQQYRLRRMDIEKVNELLNTIWNNDGLEQMFLLEQAMFNSDSDVRLSATDTSLLKKKMAYDEVEDNQEMVDKAMKDAIISE
jgi:hypothetical protein